MRRAALWPSSVHAMSPLLIPLLQRAVPYIAAGALGFGFAWQIQGLRVESAEIEFERYKIDQASAFIAAAEAADQHRKESAHAYREKQSELDQQIAKGDAYRRCVAAGKCGAFRVRVPVGAACANNGIPPGARTDATRSDAVPPGGEPAPEVIGDCAVTTLRLNELQAAVEGQAGY